MQQLKSWNHENILHECVISLRVGILPLTGEFPAQSASNAENFPFDDVIMFSLRLCTIQSKVEFNGILTSS